MRPTKIQKWELAAALAGLYELIKILVGETEAHAKVEKQSYVPILKEDLVPPISLTPS